MVGSSQALGNFIRHLYICIAWSRGVLVFVVESDSQHAIILLQQGYVRSHSYHGLVQNILILRLKEGAFPNFTRFVKLTKC